MMVSVPRGHYGAANGATSPPTAHAEPRLRHYGEMSTNLPDDRATMAHWWEYHRLSRGSRPERKALDAGAVIDATRAHQVVDDLVDVGRPEVVEWLAALNDMGPPGDDGMTVGCGPLEDLINEHADSVIDEVERLARQSPSFAQALSHVWPAWDGMATATELRLAAWIDRE